MASGWGLLQRQQADFRKDIQRILATNCIRCHQCNAASAGLKLDSPEALLRRLRALLSSGDRGMVAQKRKVLWKDSAEWLV